MSLNLFATQIKLSWSLNLSSVVIETWSFNAIVSSNLSSTFKRTFHLSVWFHHRPFRSDPLTGQWIQNSAQLQTQLLRGLQLKNFSCRNSFSSLLFVESILHYKQNIFPSNLHLNEGMNPINKWYGEFQVLSRFNSTLSYFPGRF